MAADLESVLVGEIADSVSDTHLRAQNKLVFLNTSDVLLGKVLHRTYSDVRHWPGQAKKSVRRDDILFSEIRPANGRWAFIDFDAADFVVSTKLMVIRPRAKRVVPRFLYHFLTSAETTGWSYPDSVDGFALGSQAVIHRRLGPEGCAGHVA